MSRLDELIEKFCPNGVEWKELGEIGKFENTGIDKKINEDEKKVKILNYTDVYKNNYIDKTVPKMIVTASDKKIKECTVEKWDVFITPTSEIKNDIGHASVITEDINNCCYSYHIMRFRLFKPNRVTASFIMYLFSSIYLQQQINRYAQGITRFGLTKSKFSNLKIPIPPMEIQEEIVRILDTFTQLKAELTAELTARRKQYEFYKNNLLGFNNCDERFTRVKLGDICTVNQGLQIPINKRKLESGKDRYFYITVQFLKNGNDKYYIENPPPNVICNENDILVTRTGSTGKIITGVRGCFHNNFFKINLFDGVNSRYLFYSLSSTTIYNKMLSIASGGTVPDLPHKSFYSIEIPLPSLQEQERIVSILDKFDKLCNDLSEGLPAEIEARKKQYEYYRDKLLTFKNISE